MGRRSLMLTSASSWQSPRTDQRTSSRAGGCVGRRCWPRESCRRRRRISPPLEIAKEIGNPPPLWKTYVALGDLRQAQGQPEDARQAYRDALSIIEGVAADLTDESLRETFLTSAHVQDIRRSADDVS